MDLPMASAPDGLLAGAHQMRRRRRARNQALGAVALLLFGVVVGWALPDPQVAPAEVPEVPVRFAYMDTQATSVAVAGSFNEWTPSPLRRLPDGSFTAVVAIPPGTHEYQIVVDGESWKPDPLSALQRDDGFGSVNSVLEI